MFKKIYMMVTTDKYELPLAIADSARELSEITGYSYTNILSSISHRYTASINGKITHRRFVSVEVEDDEDETL